MLLNDSWKRRFIFFLLWSFVALCFTGHAYFNYSFQGRTPALLRGLLPWELASWYTWGILSIFILRFSRRFPIERKTWQRTLPLYILPAAAFAFIHLIINVTLTWTFYKLFFESYNDLFSALQVDFFGRFMWRVFIFTVIVIACHALDANRRLHEEERKAAELRVQLASAQLQALKMQIQPHFLFNTLHSISELMHQDIAAADEMMVRLGDFLRLTLDQEGKEEVSLEEELRFLQHYLRIEEVRFKDRLKITFDIEKEALAARVPNLILQPIVENAIRHGIAPLPGPGKIEIIAGKKDHLLQIRIKDNGKGFTQQNSSGLGLRNARERLQQRYNSQHRLDLSNAPEGGLVVTLEVPFVV